MKRRNGYIPGTVATATVAVLGLVGCTSPAGEPAPRPREIVHPKDGSVMVVVPASEFVMGTDEARDSRAHALDGDRPLKPHEILLVRGDAARRRADEQPARTVTLDAFAIDRYEVTNAQYRKFLDWIIRTGDHGRCHPDEPAGKDHTPRYWGEFNPLLKDPRYARTAPFSVDTFTADDKPVVGVDWSDACAYAAWADKRLPTEAEWELAARGRDHRRWPWGNQWHWGRANTGGEKRGMDVAARGREKDGYIYAAPVGSYPEGRGPLGCDDMAGNVAEWCADWYRNDYYSTAPTLNPQGEADGRFRALRGGSSRSVPSSVRCAKRFFHEPEFRTFDLGFRCAKDYRL